MKYNILILDGQGSFGTERKCTLDYIKFMERYCPGEHNFLYQSMCEPMTEGIFRANFHVVVLTYSALSLRYLRPRERYYKIRDTWARLADLDAVKLAFPQDDYHNTNELDLLFEGLGVGRGVQRASGSYGDVISQKWQDGGIEGSTDRVRGMTEASKQ